MTVCYENVLYGPTVDTEPDSALNVSIPTTGKHKLLIVPIYGDDGVQVKFYEYTLTISAVIYNAVAVTEDIEDEVRRIKKILTTPGHQLKLYPTGIGNVPIINGTVGVRNTAYTPDLTYGPYPKELTVEPEVTNNAIFIEWTVVTNISHCESIYVKNVIQYNSDLDINVSSEGNVALSHKILYESAIAIHDITFLNSLMNALTKQVGSSFQGMRKQKRTHISKDRRIITVETTYTEIPSDSAFWPYTKNIDCTDELASSLMGDGFYRWHRRISATITLPTRIHKGWAWIVFKKILAERLRNLDQQNKAKAVDDTKPPTQTNDPTPGKNQYICMKMKITNKIYARVMSFDFEYMICTSLDTLMSKTLILARVNHDWRIGAGGLESTEEPLKLSDQWLAWDSVDITNMTGPENYKFNAPIMYSQCLTSAETNPTPSSIYANRERADIEEYDADIGSPPYVPVDSTGPGQGTSNESIHPNDPFGPAVDSNYSWIDYKNSFEVIETNDNMQVSYLAAVDNSYYQSNSARTPNRSEAGFQIGNLTQDNSQGNPRSETVARGIASYKIRMKGYAIRVGSRIPTPVLLQVSDSYVERTGKARISHKQIAQSDVTPVYLAMWDILYNVNGPIHYNDIKMASTGHPGYYA